ncbi:nucleotidyltransferase family protein [Flavimaricola marinus]|uniref:Bifunctional protein GlmU n=1 Tax=Flavimaricola marinus TaxID=1819565 RepID=A0A238LC68_9RHOB|nr:nucleotidyltransferase family protein [Flavimaricola marinus]SMY07211.1 Bifunctional protein GlmU [Flavimaricola marinus]
MTPTSIMIFAAGKGTRMAALTKDRPKPMIPVAGKPLIDHALDLTTAIRPLHRVVNLHYFGDMLRDHLKGEPNLTFSDESDQLLETGGGMKRAMPLLGPDPVFALNSDAVWKGPNPLEVLANAWDPSRMEGLVLLVRPENARGHKFVSGFATDAAGRISRGLSYMYPGAQILRTDDLGQISDQAFSLNLLWDILIERGTLYGVLYDGLWCDVGQPDNIQIAEDMLRGNDAIL